MAYNFLDCNRDQMYLLPVSIRNWLPEGHLAWFIIDVVKEFDLTSFYPWIQLPSATVKGVCVEKNTSYGVRRPRVFRGR